MQRLNYCEMCFIVESWCSSSVSLLILAVLLLASGTAGQNEANCTSLDSLVNNTGTWMECEKTTVCNKITCTLQNNATLSIELLPCRSTPGIRVVFNDDEVLFDAVKNQEIETLILNSESNLTVKIEYLDDVSSLLNIWGRNFSGLDATESIIVNATISLDGPSCSPLITSSTTSPTISGTVTGYLMSTSSVPAPTSTVFLDHSTGSLPPFSSVPAPTSVPTSTVSLDHYLPPSSVPAPTSSVPTSTVPALDHSTGSLPPSTGIYSPTTLSSSSTASDGYPVEASSTTTSTMSIFTQTPGAVSKTSDNVETSTTALSTPTSESPTVPNWNTSHGYTVVASSTMSTFTKNPSSVSKTSDNVRSSTTALATPTSESPTVPNKNTTCSALKKMADNSKLFYCIPDKVKPCNVINCTRWWFDRTANVIFTLLHCKKPAALRIVLRTDKKSNVMVDKTITSSTEIPLSEDGSRFAVTLNQFEDAIGLQVNGLTLNNKWTTLLEYTVIPLEKHKTCKPSDLTTSSSMGTHSLSLFSPIVSLSLYFVTVASCH